MSNNLDRTNNQEVHIILVPSKFSTEEYLFNNLVLNSNLKGNGQRAGRFHITIAWIKNVDQSHYHCLKKTLENVR